jgi:two-component system OmpR family response regulator
MDVSLVRWPAESALRERLSARGDARLLLLEDGQDPPLALDCLEDWIRIPATEVDVRARVDALLRRHQVHDAHPPHLDDDGVLRFADKWVPLPPLEARLAASLLERLGVVVRREALVEAMWPSGAPGRNALDVHVLRLRRRLEPLGLVVRTVRCRGYLLEASPDDAEGGMAVSS